MTYRFIKYENQIMVVKGFTYDTRFDPPECYVAVPLSFHLFSAYISIHTINVPFIRAEEITDKRVINAIITLYGKANNGG